MARGEDTSRDPRRKVGKLPYRPVPSWLYGNGATFDPDTGKNIMADLWREKTRDPNYVYDLNDYGQSYQ